VQSLSGQNSYTGTTRIDNGTLAITGNGSIAKTSITIATGGRA
jgi:autotransporter-associated beta strand protein